jgi:hypothetical protein
MAIKITSTGNQEPDIKQFPKLMVCVNDRSWITLVLPDRSACHLTGKYKGEFVEQFSQHFFTDYNEPITIQNA